MVSGLSDRAASLSVWSMLRSLYNWCQSTSLNFLLRIKFGWLAGLLLSLVNFRITWSLNPLGISV